MKKEITITYPKGNSATYEYEKLDDLYCPKCGKSSVWMEMGGSDYYVGPTHICISCESAFYLPNLGDANETEKLVIKQLR